MLNPDGEDELNPKTNPRSHKAAARNKCGSFDFPISLLSRSELLFQLNGTSATMNYHWS